MFGNYLFLSHQFNNYAYQAEYVSIIYSSGNNKKSDHLYQEYLTYKDKISDQMLDFNNKTNSSWGWVKSFIPFTEAFNARIKLGSYLHCASRLYWDISIKYFKDEARRKVEIKKVNEVVVSKDKQCNMWKKAIKSHGISVGKSMVERLGMWRR